MLIVKTIVQSFPEEATFAFRECYRAAILDARGVDCRYDDKPFTREYYNETEDVLRRKVWFALLLDEYGRGR